MITVQEFSVIEPPTSEEVRRRAFEALQAGDFLSVTVLGSREIPRPEPETVAFDISETAHPADGGMRLIGRTALDEVVTMTIESDGAQPAHGEIAKVI
ncbi:MAG TPA: hypothetical protein VN031_03870 [Candidatus Microsaccharimonas sp.]|nr:hypothetical protein [Candidatus Microsaccharimonas sp.]